MTVSTGQTLARIVGLSTVWLDVAVPEAALALSFVASALASYWLEGRKRRRLSPGPMRLPHPRQVRLRVGSRQPLLPLELGFDRNEAVGLDLEPDQDRRRQFAGV